VEKERSMKLVIAGATGLIGQLLTRSLIEGGHKITALRRSTSVGQTNVHPSLEFAAWDGKTAGNWSRHIDGADAVINLSGQSLASGRWTEARKQQLLASRIDPTTAIVEAIRAAKVKPSSLLNASAVGYYGHVPEGVVTEDHSSGEDFMGRLCSNWEAAANAAGNLGVRVILLRSSIVLDPQGGALQRMLLPYRMFVGGPLGSGNQWLPWIHREDEVRAIQFALEQTILSGPLNLVAPEPARMQEFSKALGKVLRRPSGFRVPAYVLRAILGEMADVVLSGQRAVPQKLTEAGFEFRFPMLEEALANLLQ
jgi:uncharacterized protein (TIGR01777 family)